MRKIPPDNGVFFVPKIFWCISQKNLENIYFDNKRIKKNKLQMESKKINNSCYFFK